MARNGKIIAFALALASATGSLWAEPGLEAGPLYSNFRLTLENGERTEVAGPLFYSQKSETERQWGVPPLFTLARDPALELWELEVGYPLLTWRQYGGEYRTQFWQLLSWAGGRSQADNTTRRFTLFPVYFQQRDPDDSSKFYIALFPIYGTLKNRLGRDYIHFDMFPIYSETRKKDVVTDNYLYPLYHERRGNELQGRQFWPFWGHEYKGVTFRTNVLEETEVVGGHDRFFVGPPFYMHNWDGLGTEDPVETTFCPPFYARTRSPQRSSASYGWPMGLTVTEDRAKGYREWDCPWPLVEVARGEGKTETRVFPFFSRSRNSIMESDWYAWPLWKVNIYRSAPLERQRLRVFYFLYSDTRERDTVGGQSSRRVDAWPLFSYQRDMDGGCRFQALALLDAFFPVNKSVAREYAPVYSLWRWEKNEKMLTTSQSLLWNLYRRESSPSGSRTSALFGLFERERAESAAAWRIFYIRTGQTGAANGPQAVQ